MIITILNTGNGEEDTRRPTGWWEGMLGVAASVLAVVQTDATTPSNVGTCSASWEGYDL